MVSFIAPHSLTARPLVVAPGDRVTVHNRSREEPVDVTVDGRPMCVLEAGESIAGPVRGRPGDAGPVPGDDVLPAGCARSSGGWRSASPERRRVPGSAGSVRGGW